MAFFEKRIYSGDVLEIEKYKSFNRGSSIGRGKKLKESPEAMEKVNEANARKTFIRLINENFRNGDWFLTLTYGREEPTAEEAYKELAKFLRKMRTYRKKNDLEELRYLCVTEATGKRIHHHLILNAMDATALMGMWAWRKTLSPLEMDYEYDFIAKYFSKEFRARSCTDVALSKKRWTQSKNLRKPRETKREIGRLVIGGGPRLPKGYRLLFHIWEDYDVTGLHEYIRAVRTEPKGAVSANQSRQKKTKKKVTA